MHLFVRYALKTMFIIVQVYKVLEKFFNNQLFSVEKYPIFAPL